MKHLFVKFLILCFFCSSSFGTCNWKNIKVNPDGTYTYRADLNLCVGQLVQTNKTQAQQLEDLTKAISLKNNALQESDKRANLWSNTASSLEDRLQKVDSTERHTEFIYFGLGVLAAGLATYVAAKAIGH
jgi:hypothetical protein